MAPHSSTLAWKIPWTEEPGGLQSMGSLRVGHDWATLLSLFAFMHWRRKWQPTPVFLPGESQGQRSLVGCRLRGHTQSWTWLKWLSSSSIRVCIYICVCVCVCVCVFNMHWFVHNYCELKTKTHEVYFDKLEWHNVFMWNCVAGHSWSQDCW